MFNDIETRQASVYRDGSLEKLTFSSQHNLVCASQTSTDGIVLRRELAMSEKTTGYVGENNTVLGGQRGIVTPTQLEICCVYIL